VRLSLADIADKEVLAFKISTASETNPLSTDQTPKISMKYIDVVLD
jgi:hypothetical protein